MIEVMGHEVKSYMVWYHHPSDAWHHKEIDEQIQCQMMGLT